MIELSASQTANEGFEWLQLWRAAIPGTIEIVPGCNVGIHVSGGRLRAETVRKGVPSEIRVQSQIPCQIRASR